MCVLDLEVVCLRRSRLDGAKTTEISISRGGAHEQKQMGDVGGKRDEAPGGDNGLGPYHLAHLRATAGRPEPDFNKPSC